MRITLILILFPYCIYCQQNKFTGFIIDNFGNPIQYVNVVSLKNLSGTVTDSQGFFSISVSKDDTIKLSHIAYSSKIIPINKLSSDTVTLDESLITIGEVVIKSRVNILNLSKLGFYNKDKNGEFLLKPGNQIAVFIDNPKNTPALIKSITFEVKRKGKCNSTLRLRILENQDGKIIPGKDILKENYLFNNSILTKSNTVDISKSRIFIPKEGVFIVVEWISDEIDCNLKSFPSLGANISTKENLVWYNYRDRKWSKPKESRMPNGNFMTPNISMKVYY